jgi:DNA adenine methylase
MSAEVPIYTKPFLKWAGNKFRIIHEVMKAMEWRSWRGTRHKYLEPFGGSGAVIANVDSLFEQRTYGEFNPELSDLMRSVTEETDALIAATEALFVPENNQEDAYRELRAEFNSYIGEGKASRLKKSALFIYLNRHCFNGLCRYGPNGFNVPFGRYSKPVAPSAEIKAFARKMAGVKIAQPASFEMLMDKADEHTLVYCDPPYYPLTATSNFTQYSSKSGFGNDMQKSLAETASKCAARGAIVLISNHNVDDCLTDYEMAAKRAGVKVKLDHAFNVTRFISAKSEGRGSKAGELIAAFYKD